MASTALLVASAALAPDGTSFLGPAAAAGGAGGNSGGGGTGGSGGAGTAGSSGTGGTADTAPSENLGFGTGGGGGGGGSAGGGTGGAGGGSINGFFGRGGAGTASTPDGGSGAGPGSNGTTNLAGGGGGGGYGGAHGNGALDNAATSQGGAGGAGGAGGTVSNNSSGQNAYGGGGGGGGAGGYGAIVTTGGSNTGSFIGGAGGAGGNGGGATATGTGTAIGGNGGAGGDGGFGLLITGAGGTFTNSGSGTIRGGNGGTGGRGGAAITGTGGTATNGTAGAFGAGGVGISAAGLTIINAGTIAGGFANGGAGAQANAISFTGGINTLQLQAATAGGTYAGITGNVVVQNGATGTLALGGTNAKTFDVSTIGAVGSVAQYQGFSAFQKTGTSTWTLTGTTTTVTPWTINQGTLAVSQDGNLGAASGGLTFGGGTLEITANGFTSARGITLNTAGTVQTDTGVTATLSGTIANGTGGAGNLTKTGLGTLILTGASTYTGGTAINAGTLSAANASALGTGAATVAAGATLDVNAVTIGNALTLSGTGVNGGGALTGTGTAGVSGPVTLAADTAVGVALAGDTLTLSGAIGGAGFGLTKVGAGTLVLSGANTYTGTTTLTAGTLEARNGAAIADTSRVAFNNAAGTAATFRVTNSETIGSLSGGNASSTVAIAAGQTLTVGGDNTSDGNYAGAITGAAGLLVKTGTGTQTLSGALTNGGVQVGQGGLVLSGSLTTAGTAYNGSAPAALVDRGGTALTVSGTITATSAAGLEDAVQLNGGSLTLTSTGQITGKTRGVNALTGGTISNAGSITGGVGIAFQTAGAQTFTVTGAGSITGTGNGSNGIQGQAMGTGAITLGTLAGPLGNVSGQNAGIGFSAANNPISIVTSGTITGQSDNGIYVNQPNGTAAIAITQLGGSIASNVGNLAPAASAALYAISGSGPVTISTAGSVTSNNGAAIRIDGTGTNSVTNSGTVQGVIGLRVVGGTTTLANTGTLASTAVGGNALQIDSGTMIIGEQAGTLTGNLNIASAASTLRVDRMADLSLANPITGAGTLDKRGTGTLILTGQSPAFTGDTIVNAGVLQVDGLLGSANVTVNNGGTLAGSGKIGDPLINAGGTLAPGSASTIGTLSITGPLTFAPGSFYAVKITPTVNDRTNVTGTTTIQGGTVQVSAGTGTYTPNLRYTLLSSTAGVTGRFSALQTTSNLAFLTPSLSYDANTVYLGFAQTAAITTVASSPNQTGVAAALNGAAPTVTTTVTTNPTTGQTTTQTSLSNITPAAQVATAVLNQTAPGAVQALNSLSGEIQASAISAELQTAFVVQEAILDHLRFGEGNGFGGPGIGSPGLTGAIGQRFAPGTTLPAMYTADLPGGPAVGAVPVRPVPPSYGVWGQAFGSFGDAGDRNAARLTRQVGGFVLGAETGAGVLGGPFSDWRAGVAAGYSFTAFDVTARQSTGQVESGFGAVYARGPLGPLQIRLGAAYAGNALDTRRAVIFPGFSQSVSGKAGGDTVQGFGEVGYRIGFAAGYVEPFVGGAAIHIRRDGFAETGGASALTVYGRSYDVQTATAGIQGQAVVADLFGGAGPLVARGLVGYRRAFGDVVPQALLAFGGGGQAFLTAGVPVARDAVVASAGLDWQVGPRTTVGLSYNGQVGARAQDHAVKGSLSYRW